MTETQTIKTKTTTFHLGDSFRDGQLTEIWTLIVVVLLATHLTGDAGGVRCGGMNLNAG